MSNNYLADDARDKVRVELQRRLRKFYRRASAYASRQVLDAFDEDQFADPERVADEAVTAACGRYQIDDGSKPELTAGEDAS